MPTIKFNSVYLDSSSIAEATKTLWYQDSSRHFRSV